MKFQSINQIKEEFNIKGENISEIRKQLLEILKQIHPDNNNGKFKSESDQGRFTLLTEALEFLKNENYSEALVSTDKNTDILNFTKNELTLAEKEERINQKKEECRNVNREYQKSRYFLPRLGSGFFSGFCALLIAFAEQLKTHPLFSQILGWGKLGRFGFYRDEYRVKDHSYESYVELMMNNTPERAEFLNQYKQYSDSLVASRLDLLLLILLILFIYSGLLFILTWIRERKDQAKSEWLLSEEGLRYIFQQLATQKITGQEQGKYIQFTKRDLETEIKKFYERQSRWRLPFQAKSKISPSFTEKTAKLYIEEMTNRNLLKIVQAPKFDITYEVKREIIDDLIGENMQLA